MNRLSALAPALLSAFALLAGAAHADQLEWIPRADAERAAAALTPGSLVVQWVSHMGDSRPVIQRIESVEVCDVAGQDGLAEVRVCAIKVASSRTLRQPSMGPFQFALGAVVGPAQTSSIDLAYTYVASSEMPGVFVNLGKRLGLDCSIKVPAIEVGCETVAAIEARFEAPVCEERPASSSTPSRGIADRVLGEDGEGDEEPGAGD